MEHHFDTEDAKKYGVECAVVLYNIKYWCRINQLNNRNRHEHTDGKEYYWTYNSVSAFTSIFSYLTIDQIRDRLQKLEKMGAIISGNFNATRYDRTKWYSTPIHSVNSPNGNGEVTEPIPDIKPDIKPDTLAAAAASVSVPVKKKKSKPKPKPKPPEPLPDLPKEPEKPFSVEDALSKMEEKVGSHLDIIASFVRESGLLPKIKTRDELKAIITRHCKAAAALRVFVDFENTEDPLHRIYAAFDECIEESKRLKYKWGLDTVLTKITK